MRALLITLVLSSVALADPAPARPTSPADIAKARSELAAKAFASTLSRFEVGSANVEDVARWSLRWLDASLDGATGRAVTTALAGHAARMKDLDDKAIAASNTGRTYGADADAATYFRLEADLWVARGKR
jgi:hypothetical protein